MQMNNKSISLLFFLIWMTFLATKAQTVYHDAAQFQLLGKLSSETETRYERLPSNLRDVSRGALWYLGKNTAGLAIRFSSNSTAISATWTVKNNTVMNHMTPTGIQGLDLYCLEDTDWVFVNSARPTGTEKEKRSTIIANMESKDREYLLYLPLYDGLIDLQVGIDSLATIDQPQIALPVVAKPIVAYGTSILQGGCASRAGMAHTNILGRWLNKEIINLGFSGNGRLDYEIATLMSTADASIFILDCMPNVEADEVYEKLEHFYELIRQNSPTTPIIFIENPMFPQATYDRQMYDKITAKNEALHEVFNSISQRDVHVSLISSDLMIGLDREATVDGIHFTDLGFMRYAEYLYPTLKRMLDDNE